jgi:hypothetical protein
MNEQPKPARVSEIVERALTQLPPICDDNYNSMAVCRKVITRACEEAHTLGWDVAMRSCGNQIQELRAQVESLANDRNHWPVTRLEMGGDLVTALPEETLLGSKHCPDTENVVERNSSSAVTNK